MCLVPREYIIMVITLPQRKRGVHLLEPVKRFKGHHYSFRQTQQTACVSWVKIPVLKPISNHKCDAPTLIHVLALRSILMKLFAGAYIIM